MAPSSQSGSILLVFSSLFFFLLKIFCISQTLGFLSCHYMRQSMRVLSLGVLLSFILPKFSFLQIFPVFTSLMTHTDVLPTAQAICYCWSSLLPSSVSPEQTEGTVCCKYLILSLRNIMTLSRQLSKELAMISFHCWTAGSTKLIIQRFESSTSIFSRRWQEVFRLIMVYVYKKVCSHECSVFHSTMTNFMQHFTSSSCSMNACSPLHSSKFAWHPSCHNERAACSSVLQ